MFQTLFKLSDTAMNVLFSFFALFFATIARTMPALSHSFISKLPGTKNAARSSRASARTFTQYVCCPSCHSIYNWNECIIQDPDDQLRSKLCTFQRFPNHPQRQHRHPCGQSLMKKIKSSNGRLSLYPHLIYCYKSVIESLQDMVSRPGFIEKCELWRERNTLQDVYTDVYDGKIWRDFMSIDGVQFLSAPYNYALHLNVDWFQPFRHTQHSEGAIYLSVLNLPRQERFFKGECYPCRCDTWA